MRITRVSLLALLCFQIVAISAVNAATSDSSDRSHEERDGMVWIPSGTFWMGCEEPSIRDAKPLHQVFVDGFWMDRTEVTNKEFARFIRATGYKTVAERELENKGLSSSPAKKLEPGAMVFSPPEEAVSKQSHLNWWRYISGANWQHPEGPGSDLKGRLNHPVVDIAWEDANAYAEWANKRLPTEAEFEYAARGGLDRTKYSWGNELKPNGKWQANIWQGHFPYENSAEDGFKSTSPCRSFSPNGYGLYDVTGNVWEWCADWYRPNYQITAEAIVQNPTGPNDSFDPGNSRSQSKVLRGGSFLCTNQYCSRFLVGARAKGEMNSRSSNTGFRCVKNDPRK